MTGLRRWVGVLVLVGSVGLAAGDVAFVYAAATSQLGPVWPTTFLGLTLLAGIAFVVILCVSVAWRLPLLACVVSLVLLAGTTGLNLWAAYASSAAV